MRREGAAAVGLHCVSTLIRRAAVVPMAALLLVMACGGENGVDRDERGAPAAATAGAGDNILVVKGCPQCHSVERLNIRAAADIGPDLSDAATNVPSRYGRSLDEFFDQPSGTMQVVLGHQIQLTEAETDSIVRLLTRLSEER
jgi:hypothetical protein